MSRSETLAQALAHFNADRPRKAEAICRKLLRKQPRQPDALHLLGVVALRQGQHGRAVELIESAIEQNGAKAAFHINLGEAYRGLGKLDRAIECLDRALAIDPERVEALCALGNVYASMGDGDAAIASFERALICQPGFSEAYYNKGNVHAGRGEGDPAIDAYRAAVAHNPSFVDAHFNLGNSLQSKGDLTAAVEAYENAVRVLPSFASAWFNMGNALRKLGRLEAAKDAYEHALEDESLAAGARLHIGTIAKLQNRLDTAQASLEEAIRLDPDMALSHSERAHVLLLKGNLDDAIAGYRHAVALDPDFSWGHMGLSSALEKAGELEEARRVSRQAVRIRPTFEWPFLGTEPVGRLVVLKALEDGYFRIGNGDEVKFSGGVNNVDVHFDRTRFTQCSVYVDGFDIGDERFALPPCDVIFNIISDTDAMPQAHAIAKRIAETTDFPIINHPLKIERTRRHENYERLAQLDGIVFPKTLRLERAPDDGRQMAQLLDDAELDPPLLIRCAGTHTGESLEKIDTTDRLAAYFASNPVGPYYLSEFVDFSDDSGRYSKMRVFVVDGQVFPNHLYFFDDWRISQAKQVLPHMTAHPWMFEDAKAFLADPERHLGTERFRAVEAMCRAIDLDYFGVDFACLPDGRALIFEANPVMRLPALQGDSFPFRKPYTVAITRALTRLLESRIAESKAHRAG